MKKSFIITAICLAGFLSSGKVHAQTAEIEQLLLNIEKLAQLKQVLADMKKTYDVLYKGYTQVKNIAEGNFNLHEQFITGLMEVSPSVKKYKRVAEIIRMQQQIIKQYKARFESAKQSGLLNLSEITYTAKVYEGLAKQSLIGITELVKVLTAGTYKMDDDERITKIDEIWRDMQDQLAFVQHFANNNQLLILARKKDKANINAIRTMNQ